MRIKCGVGRERTGKVGDEQVNDELGDLEGGKVPLPLYSTKKFIVLPVNFLPTR
jgi:hypothetical protein